MRGRRSGSCPLVPSGGGRGGLSVPCACSQGHGDSVLAPLPMGLWDPARSEGSCCGLAGWGVSAHPPADPGKQAGEKSKDFRLRVYSIPL